MKSLLLTAALLAAHAAPSQAATLLDEGFDDLDAAVANGWFKANLSDPIGLYGWEQGFSTSGVSAYSGGAGSFAIVNFEASAVDSGGTIDAWLVTPTLSLDSSNTLSFFTRTATSPALFPDRLQVLISVAGSSTAVAEFSVVLTTVNDNLSETGYPADWAQYSVTFALSQPAQGRIAFRYNLPNSTDYGDLIGLDNVLVTTNAVPEPASAALLLLGVAGIAGLRRRAGA